ncbi:hypothetical protein OHF03_02380 [Escherichia coli]|nr:hypothetical protein [Escherichia coli]MCV3075468.1 hypothetical protein [Escherichia coli]
MPFADKYIIPVAFLSGLRRGKGYRTADGKGCFFSVHLPGVFTLPVVIVIGGDDNLCFGVTLSHDYGDGFQVPG